MANQPPSGSDPIDNGGERRGSPKMGTAIISGAIFKNKAVVYYDVEGIAILEGDIAIGRVRGYRNHDGGSARLLPAEVRSPSVWV